LNGARRILAVLECRPSDAAVLSRAVKLAAESGGYLTVVAVAPGPIFNPSPYCFPQPSPEVRRAEAASVLQRLAPLVPREIPVITAVDDGKLGDVIARRVERAAHDLVVVRRRRLSLRSLRRPLLTAVLPVG